MKLLSCRILAVTILISILSVSCMHKKMIYLQSKTDTSRIGNEYLSTAPEYIVKINDILYIDIVSTNKDLNTVLKADQQNNSNQLNNSNFYLSGYTVNDSGFFRMPVLGTIWAEGRTIKQIQDTVQQITDSLLNNAIAKVKFVSFYVTFLGEVGSQGKLTIMQDNVNILDGLALAGGISDYGNRKNVLLVRKTDNGSQTYRLDLTNRNILASQAYYLQPNDIVIIEPLKNKSFQLGVRDYTLVLTTITSTITMILLVANLF